MKTKKSMTSQALALFLAALVIAGPAPAAWAKAAARSARPKMVAQNTEPPAAPAPTDPAAAPPATVVTEPAPAAPAEAAPPAPAPTAPAPAAPALPPGAGPPPGAPPPAPATAPAPVRPAAARSATSSAVRRAVRKLQDVRGPNGAARAGEPAAAAPDPSAPLLPPPVVRAVEAAPPTVNPWTAPPAGATAGAPAGTSPGTPGQVDIPGEKEFNSCRKLPPGKRIVKLNLKPETDLQELVGWISSITCTQFLIPGTTVLSGKKITIISPQLITTNEAYRLFLAAIESVGLTVEPTDKFLRIVETNRARFTNVDFLTDGESVPSDRRYVTRMVHLKYLDATEVTTTVLQRLKGEQGDIIPYQKSTLIITDQAVMINKMIQLLEELDIPTGTDERVWMIRVSNTSAIEMAARLAELFEIGYVGRGFSRKPGAAGGAAAAPRPPAGPEGAAKKNDAVTLKDELQITKLIPVERSNHLIVVAKPVAYEWLKLMIRKIDVPLGDQGHDRVHVYNCEHASCDELAVTLGAVTGIPVSIAGGARRPGAGGAGAAVPAASGAAANAGQPTENVLFEGDVRINFDRPTNSLVVVSSIKDYQSLRRVITRLDQPRKQVFIEALVMEVLLDKSREVGVAYHGGKSVSIGGADNSLLLGGFQANKTLAPASLVSGSALNGLAGALFGPVLPQSSTRIFGSAVEIPGIGVMLQALQNNNDVNVLSNPSLTITNNEEGELSVGQNLPFPGALMGGFGGAGAAGGLGGLIPSVSVQRQDVALKMKIVPSVNQHNMIRMEVDQEISDIVSPNFNGLGPATSKRTAKTTVVTRDQQTVLIGGLMSDRTSETVTKIPVLGDIPILGFFFRSKKTNHQKTNIIIALTPHVLTDPDDMTRVVEKKMRERREFIERFTAFQDDYKANADTDYSKKRGMLEQINRTVHEIEDEERAIADVRARDLEDSSSPIELPEGVRPPPRGKRGGSKTSPKPIDGASNETTGDPAAPRRLAATSRLPDEPIEPADAVVPGEP